jgi:hypothetical protein
MREKEREKKALKERGERERAARLTLNVDKSLCLLI